MLSSNKICFKAGENFKILSMVLKLKLEGMTKEYLDSLPILF